MLSRTRAVALTVIPAVIAALPASAAAQPFRFTFADQNGVTTANFSTTVGGTVPVRVYLTENISGSVLATQGLAAFGVQLTCNTAIARVNNATNIVPAPAFADDFLSDAFDSVALLEAFTFGNPALPDAANRIYLGTFTYTGTGVGMAVILTADPNPELSFDNTLTGLGTVIDAQIANSTALITVAPSLCPLDLSNNGIVDADDIFAFLAIWFDGPPGAACITPATGCPGDWNNDGTITADDIFSFLGDWFAFGPGTACP